MKKAKSVALIGAGKLTDSPLSRFYWLSDRLGPVKSTSFRLASRIANHLRAGHPVKDYEDFHSCSLILVCVPDEMLPRAVAELLSAGIDWQGKAVVLCSLWLDSSELHQLSASGAAVGSICPVPGFDDFRYLVEGDRLAVLQSRYMVEHRDRRVVAIERSLKPFYLAALTCTSTVMFSLVMAAAESLRHAGVPLSFSTEILEKQVGRTFRAYLRAGRKGFPATRELSRQVRALSSADPELAQYLEQSSRLAERLFQSDRPLR
jgi:predicted short-subunit dehydrogenase-like oxidoreductase (DUF2520 family)